MSKRRTHLPSENLELTAKEPVEKAHYTTKSGIRKAVRIIPRNVHQEEYLEYLLDPQKIVILAHGPAGCGKTFLSMQAGIKALSEKTVDKLILCRPAIGVEDEDHGFLPGDINEKMQPWVQPMIDVLYEYYSGKEIEMMVENKIVEIIPLMYMRGRNIKNAFVIADEFQNATISQCKALLTRLCENSKVIMTGDNAQSDKRANENGLLLFKNLLEKYGEAKYIASVEFNHKDIERHPVVSEVLKIFGDF
jgi:phosphate starvation-inducible PhoH-like protein